MKQPTATQKNEDFVNCIIHLVQKSVPTQTVTGRNEWFSIPGTVFGLAAPTN